LFFPLACFSFGNSAQLLTKCQALSLLLHWFLANIKLGIAFHNDGKLRRYLSSGSQVTILDHSSMKNSNDVMPIVSKLYCSTSPVVLLVRKRPVVVNGGGFVVTDRSNTVLFAVDGCGKLGAKGVLMVKDGEGESILYIHKKVSNLRNQTVQYRPQLSIFFFNIYILVNSSTDSCFDFSII
jgi:LURP-one-related